MFSVLGVMILGVGVGYILRRIPNITVLGKLITLFIFLLLFSLGISVGHNETILTNLTSLGLQAFVITFGAIAGSVLMGWALYKYLYLKEKEDER